MTQPRAAYIHVPFCRHRCGYCNFTLIAGRDDLISDYLLALGHELSGLGAPRAVDTLYLGGGTPSHLPPPRLRELFECVLHWHPLAAGGELTVEVNPSDLDRDRAAVLGEFGVTRVSLGAQSFHPRKLRVLERDHAPADIFTCCDRIRDFSGDVALDLIFAAPQETVAEFSQDLSHAVALEPVHISTYGLTYEPDTPFATRLARKQLQEVDEEDQRAMYLEAAHKLPAAGYEHYEVSNFALPSKRSRHNQVYWSGLPYYAAGPGASRYVNGRRETNYRSVPTYIRQVLSGASATWEIDELSLADRAREMLVIGLRRLEGIDRNDFHRRFGFPVDALCGESLGRLVANGLISDDGERIALTRAGLLVSDALWPELL